MYFPSEHYDHDQYHYEYDDSYPPTYDNDFDSYRHTIQGIYNQ